MTNQSLYSAFERFRQHILIVLGNKSNIDHTHDTSDITSGVLDVEYGGTGYDSIVDTTYTTPRYRASALVSIETIPDNNGIINWMYE